MKDFKEIIKSVFKTLLIIGFFVLIAYFSKQSLLKAGYKPINKRTEDDKKENKDDRIKQAESVDIVYKQVSGILFYTILAIGISIALIHNGIQTTSVFAMLGTLGLTVGLSLQSTVSNIWDGMNLLINDMYRIGDIVEIKTQGIPYVISGKVVDFNLFHTKIADITNGSEINISNNILRSSIVNNKTVRYSQN